MKDVQKSALDKAIIWLKAAGCTFAIIDADGNKHGELDVKEKKTRKRTSPYPYGELAAYVSTYLKDLKVGEVGEVPLGKYDRQSIQSSCSSWMCRVFGNGSHTTALDPKRKVIEVLRIS
jgi:hypothetical protein